MSLGIQKSAKGAFSALSKGQQVVYYIGNLAKDRGVKTEKRPYPLTESQRLIDKYAEYWLQLEEKGFASLVQKKVGNVTHYIAQKRK